MPSGPNASKKARFALTAATYGQARLDEEPRERLDPAGVGREAGRQRARVRVEPEAEDGPRRRRSCRETLEEAAGHGAVEPLGLAAGADGVAAGFG